MAAANPQSKAKKSPRLASGRKNARKSLRRNVRNTALRTRFRSVIKTMRAAIAAKDAPAATKLLGQAQSVLDSVAAKGVFHKNKSARQKSRLAQALRRLSAPAA